VTYQDAVGLAWLIADAAVIVSAIYCVAECVRSDRKIARMRREFFGD
jgi:hypothetical protein